MPRSAAHSRAMSALAGAAIGVAHAASVCRCARDRNACGGARHAIARAVPAAGRSCVSTGLEQNLHHGTSSSLDIRTYVSITAFFIYKTLFLYLEMLYYGMSAKKLQTPAQQYKEEVTHEEIWKEYMQTPISHSGSHYLLAIETLNNTKGFTRLTDLAHYLDISPGSCHTTLSKLKKAGLVEETDTNFLKLTEKGKRWSFQVQQNHKILYSFFISIGVPELQARTDACKMEHLVSPETIGQLSSLLNLSKAHAPVAAIFQQLVERHKESTVEDDKLSKFCRVHTLYTQS